MPDLSKNSNAIAFARTVAPIVWGFVISSGLKFGIGLDTWLVDNVFGGVLDEATVASLGTGLITINVWLLARWQPDLLERLFLLVRVDGYAYQLPDGDLATPTGKATDGAKVIDLAERLQPTSSPSAKSEILAETFARSNPSEVELRSAAARLLEMAERAA